MSLKAVRSSGARLRPSRGPRQERLGRSLALPVVVRSSGLALPRTWQRIESHLVGRRTRPDRAIPPCSIRGLLLAHRRFSAESRGPRTFTRSAVLATQAREGPRHVPDRADCRCRSRPAGSRHRGPGGRRGASSSGPARLPARLLPGRGTGRGVEFLLVVRADRADSRAAPVLVFHHGWLAVNPGVYGAWIEHLCRRGFVVIFPRYHADWLTSPSDYLPNALAAVRDALDVLELGPNRVRPDRERFALIGHSAGGTCRP